MVGTTGTGKTMVARAVAQHLELPHIELDALYWDANWTGVSEDVFVERVLAAIRGERWVVDGNYSRVRGLVWARAETVVYLDYPFWRVFWQLLQRTIRRSQSGEELWSGNRELLRRSIFSRDSILVWMLQTYHRRQKQYAELFQKPEFAHLQVVHLEAPPQTAEWLAQLDATTQTG